MSEPIDDEMLRQTGISDGGHRWCARPAARGQGVKGHQDLPMDGHSPVTASRSPHDGQEMPPRMPKNLPTGGQ